MSPSFSNLKEDTRLSLFLQEEKWRRLLTLSGLSLSPASFILSSRKLIFYRFLIRFFVLSYDSTLTGNDSREDLRASTNPWIHFKSFHFHKSGNVQGRTLDFNFSCRRIRDRSRFPSSTHLEFLRGKARPQELGNKWGFFHILLIDAINFIVYMECLTLSTPTR